MNSKHEQMLLREAYRKIQEKRWNGNKHMIDYCTNKPSRFVKLTTGHILAIEKPRIKTRFCFGYSLNYNDFESTERMAEHAANSKEYFKKKNLQEFQDIFDTLNRVGRWSNYVPYFYYADDGEAYLKFCHPWEQSERGIKAVSEQDRKALIEAYKLEIAAFEKRIDTYLKKYGMRKVKTWTYCMDD